LIPISVNYHFSRKCNAECKFCFHTELDSYHAPREDAEKGLKLLKDAGMQKVNFAGGEPFLYPKLLGQMCKFAKVDLQLESVSIVSNGTKVSEKWLREHGPYIDILAVSCDSFDAATNAKIGRADRASGKPFDNVQALLNAEEDMVETVKELAPFRWKVFQMLLVEGENENANRIRDARELVVTDEQFEAFCAKHKAVKGFTPESNALMKTSYLILDEYIRFLNPADKSQHSESILDVGVQKALEQVSFDQEGFEARGGVYDWTRD
ncbi:hypothetical protein BDV95DRAFT_440525, partial [Massariosphaeria phaeospora]